MTVVTASPAAVSALAQVLHEAGDELRRTSSALARTADDAAMALGRAGELARTVAAILGHQGTSISELATDLDRFVDALVTADQLDAAVDIGRLMRLPDRDTVLVRADVIALHEPLDPDGPVRELVRVARGARAVHAAAEPPPGRAHQGQHRRWSAELAAIDARIRQYEAFIDPPYRGWGGSGTGGRWTASELLSAISTGTLHATAMLPAPSEATHARARLVGDAAARRAFAAAHPFVASAIEHDVLLTPERLAILRDLDALAGMPLDDFLAARAEALSTRPDYDWTTDGCSGPVPDRAQDACLRHDFLYRNARMLRDQWGLTPEFAGALKRYADDRFGSELDDPYPWWDLGTNPGLLVWFVSAEVAVSFLGDVSAPWQPPPPHRFYGALPP